MDFLSKTKNSLMSAGASFSQKASEVSGSVTLTMKVHDEEKQLENNYTELGKAIMGAHADKAKELFPDLCGAIETLKKQLEIDKKSLAQAKGYRVCANCGSAQRMEVVCCTQCGINLNEAEHIMAETSAMQNMQQGMINGNQGVYGQPQMQYIPQGSPQMVQPEQPMNQPIQYDSINMAQPQINQSYQPQVQTFNQTRCCPSCGNAIDGTEQFCMSCGTRLM